VYPTIGFGGKGFRVTGMGFLKEEYDAPKFVSLTSAVVLLKAE